MTFTSACIAERERIRNAEPADLATAIDELMSTANTVAVRLTELDQRDAYEHVTQAWMRLYDACALLEKIGCAA